MKQFLLGLSVLFGMGWLIVGCGDSGSGSSGCSSGEVACDGECIPEIVPTLDGAQGVQAAVFGQTCAFTNCHGSMGAAQAGLELSSVSVSDENLIDVDSTQVPTKLRVDPGDSSASYLMDKLLGMDIQGTQPMPIGGMLCGPRLEAVRQWIDDGAPIN